VPLLLPVLTLLLDLTIGRSVLPTPAFSDSTSSSNTRLPNALPDAPGPTPTVVDAMDTSSNHGSAADTSTTADSASNNIPPVAFRATREPSCDEPFTAPINTRPAADLFTDHGDAPAGRPDIDFYTSRTSEPVSASVPWSSRLASPPLISLDMSTAHKGERPKPRLMRYHQPRNENEPFNLQDRVFPNRSENTGPSGEHSSNLTAKLIALQPQSAKHLLRH